MKATLIPFRTYHFSIPQQSVMKTLQLIIDHEINYSLDSVTDDEQFLSLSLSINLNKRYQRSAVKQIEQLLPTRVIPNP